MNNITTDLCRGHYPTVGADDTTETFKLYLGGENGVEELVASLSAGSPEVAVLLVSNQFGSFTKCVTVEYRAVAPGQSFTFDYRLSDMT